MSSKQVIREIGKWESENIIPSALADTLRARYENKSGKRMLTVILSIIGSVLMGAGVVLIVASNWNRIPLVPKTIISFLPLVTAQCLGVFTYLKKKDSLVWRESVAVLWAAGVFSSLAMIGQSFHLANDLSVYLVSAGLLTLPVVFALDAVSPLVVYFYAVIHGGTLLLMDYSSAPYLLLLLLLTALGLIYPVLGRKKTDIRALYTRWCSVVAGTVVMGIVGFALSDELVMSLLGLLAACLYVSAGKNSGAENPFKFFGVLGTVVFTVFTAFSLAFDGYWYTNRFTDAKIWLFFALFLIMLLYAVTATVRRFRGCIHELLFAITGIAASTLSLICLLLELSGVAAGVFFTLIAFALGIGLIVRGTGEGSLKLTNLGLLTVFSVIAFWFFEMISSTLLNGVLFMLFGGAILFVNVRLIKKNKAREALNGVSGSAEEEM